MKLIYQINKFMKLKQLLEQLNQLAKERPEALEMEVQIVSGIDNDIEQVKLRTIKVEGGFKDIVNLEGWIPF